jgi:hypothetical protein
MSRDVILKIPDNTFEALSLLFFAHVERNNHEITRFYQQRTIKRKMPRYKWTAGMLTVSKFCFLLGACTS